MSEPLLQARGVSKRFPGVQALDRVDLEVWGGEVHILLGENGAGKSTLMKILAGVHQPDEGELRLRGEPVRIHAPKEAQRLGIATIYQEFNLVPDLTVAENMFLGHEPARGGFVDFRTLNERAKVFLDELAIPVRPDALVRTLGVAQRQMIEIAKALTTQATVLTMDEPTAALSDREVETLFQTIRKLTAKGVAVIYISHRMPELFAIGDRVTVMRDGATVGVAAIAETTPDALIRLMVGRELKDLFPPPPDAPPGPPLLEVKGLTRPGVIEDVSLSVRAGEVVGIAGLVGSGRTEVLRAIFGADPAEGEVAIHGRPVRIKEPQDAVSAGIGFLTEDRKGQGLALGMTIRENISMGALSALSSLGLISKRQEADMARDYIGQLAVRPASSEHLAGNLSGGNQQKVVLAKWLATRSEILFFDEPTRGIDVGARAEIYQLMREQTREGKGILMVSSDLQEVLGMSDRILVISHGRLVGELPRHEATQEKILALATGD